jgi:hypothetical protein
MMSVSNVVLQNQAMVLIAFLYMLGFILSGIKPNHMLWIGTLAAVCVFIISIILIYRVIF